MSKKTLNNEELKNVNGGAIIVVGGCTPKTDTSSVAPATLPQ